MRRVTLTEGTSKHPREIFPAPVVARYEVLGDYTGGKTVPLCSNGNPSTNADFFAAVSNTDTEAYGGDPLRIETVLD
jgi:hypothetical protein